MAVLAAIVQCLLIHAAYGQGCDPTTGVACDADPEKLPEVSLLQANMDLFAEVDAAGKATVSGKQGAFRGQAKVTAEVAMAREKARVKLAIEQDFKKLGSQYLLEYNRDMDCTENANAAFAHAQGELNLADELTEEELTNFMARFVEEMEVDCKNDPLVQEHFTNLVALALQHQKPVLTETLVQSINDAGLGFTVVLPEDSQNESQSDYEEQQGTVLPPANELLLEMDNSSLSFIDMSQVPASYDSRESLGGVCRDVIGRVFNQGRCGSCWAFGGQASVDGRLCLATNGRFSGDRALLSRGYITSCAKPGNANGCGGGWFTYIYKLLGRGESAAPAGVPTGGPEGCSPYFAHGQGTEHFASSSPAPPCPTQCGNSGYSRTLQQDTFVMPAISSVTLRGGSGNDENHARARAEIFTNGPVAAAMKATSAFMGYSSGVFSACASRPNHAVVAIGYGPDNFQALNSWGDRWGNHGGYTGLDCTFTHWSIPNGFPTEGLPDIPGASPAAPSASPVAQPTSFPTPSPTPPPGYFSAWTVQSGSCAVDDFGCVTSPNYDGGSTRYGNRERCTVQVGDHSAPIEVVDFDTEGRWDKLTVNGVHYSGSAGQNLHGITPNGDMKWYSDGSVVKTGWKLCPRTGGGGGGGDSDGNPTAPPSAFPTEPPTGFPTEPPTGFPTEPPTGFPTEPPTETPSSAPTAPMPDDVEEIGDFPAQDGSDMTYHVYVRKEDS